MDHHDTRHAFGTSHTNGAAWQPDKGEHTRVTIKHTITSRAPQDALPAIHNILPLPVWARTSNKPASRKDEPVG